jgi:hypothetical protein
MANGGVKISGVGQKQPEILIQDFRIGFKWHEFSPQHILPAIRQGFSSVKHIAWWQTTTKPASFKGKTTFSAEQFSFDERIDIFGCQFAFEGVRLAV